MQTLRRDRVGWLVGIAAAAVVLSATGLGFSAFTASAVVNGSATPGSVDLLITNVSFTSLPDPPYGPYVQTSVLPASVATAWVNNTIAGTAYNITVIVENFGTVPIHHFGFVVTSTVGGPSNCHVGATFSNAAINEPAGGNLAPGVPFTTYWTLNSGHFPVSCGGDTYLAFTIQFTGTASI